MATSHPAKIAGYLLKDVWTEPGAVVFPDCRAGFKQALWSLGTLLAGAHVAVGQTPSGGLTAAAIDAPERWVNSTANGVKVFAVDPALLAIRWTGESLPPGVRDAAVEALGASNVLMDEAAHEALNWQLRGGDVFDLDSDHGSISDPGSGPSPDSDPSLRSVPTGPGSGASSDRDSGSGPSALSVTRARARLLAAPSPSQALETAAGTLASVRLVVVDDPGEAERTRIAEDLDEVWH